VRRIIAIAHKELLHILRDPRSLALAILQPMVMLLLYGYAINMDIKRLKVGILDLDQTQESADFIRRMTSGNFILDAGRVYTREEVEPSFRRHRFQAVLVFPKGYAKALSGGPVTQIQVLLDGADGTTASAADNYLKAVIALLSQEVNATGVPGGVAAPIQTRPRILYNPELESAHFIVPGLVALIMIQICALLTSIAITREKETGTLEQMLTTPVRPGQVIVGKVIPYLGIAILDAVLIFAVGTIVFGVPMEGSWLVLSGYSLLYLAISLGLGLLISAVARTQQIAMQMAQLMTVLPVMMLSGFVFPISSMPLPLQLLSRTIPATYYLKVVRGVMLKGEAWFPIEAAVMVAMAVLVLVMAARRFQERLD
jgi:ABC-2 type transport system permease protein